MRGNARGLQYDGAAPFPPAQVSVASSDGCRAMLRLVAYPATARIGGGQELVSWFSNQLFRVVLSRRMVVEAGPLGLTRAQINEWITMRNRARFGRSQRLRYRGSDGNEGRDQGVGVRCRCRPRERAAVGCLSAADTAYIRRETRYAKRDPGILCQPRTNSLHALPNRKGRLDIWPQRSDLASLGRGFLRAAARQTGPGLHDPVGRIVHIISTGHQPP